MKTQVRTMSLAVAIAGLCGPMLAAGGQAPAPMVQANPTPGCKVSDKELEANKQAALKFFQTRGAERVALADPSYIQHNPVFKKRAKETGETDFEEYRKAFMAQANQPPPAPTANAGPQPPAGNQLEIVTAECDIVTIVHKAYRPDPTAPGTFFEAFTFDTFRVKNGKLVEHWDAAVITAPAN